MTIPGTLENSALKWYNSWILNLSFMPLHEGQMLIFELVKDCGMFCFSAENILPKQPQGSFLGLNQDSKHSTTLCLVNWNINICPKYHLSRKRTHRLKHHQKYSYVLLRKSHLQAMTVAVNN